MSELPPEVQPGASFAAYAPPDIDVEDVRKELMQRTGLGIHIRFRIGPIEVKSPTEFGLPCVPVDEDFLTGEFKGELPLDGSVVYVGEYMGPIAPI